MAFDRSQAVRLSLQELLLISSALNELLHGAFAIDEWEFEIQTGARRADAQDLLERILTQLDGA
jgi:hypothetical protein